jgi:hypothetical protein
MPSDNAVPLEWPRLGARAHRSGTPTPALPADPPGARVAVPPLHAARAGAR